MQTNLRRKLAIGTTALAAAAFAGGAYAANQEPGAGARQAFLGDVAKRLNVSPAQLRAALRGAFDDQLQAAVAAGKLTPAQANAIKQREQQAGAGPPERFWFGHRRGGPLEVPGPSRLAAAAKYLGVSESQLADELGAGKTLAQLAKARSKSIPGLEAAMSTAVRSRLDKALAQRLITSAQEQQILGRLKQRLAHEINGTRIGPGMRVRPRFHEWHGRELLPAHPPGAAAPAPPSAPPGPVY